MDAIAQTHHATSALQVLLSRVRPELLTESRPDDEAHAIHRRELYVGMTRARDALWVGVCA